MTGWYPSIESLHGTCPDFEESGGVLGSIVPAICGNWLGLKCDMGHICPWAGQPPQEDEELGYKVWSLPEDC